MKKSGTGAQLTPEEKASLKGILGGITASLKAVTSGISTAANVISGISGKINGLLSTTSGYDPTDLVGPPETWNYIPGPTKLGFVPLNIIINGFYN